LLLTIHWDWVKKMNTTLWYVLAYNPSKSINSFKRGMECGHFQLAVELSRDENSTIQPFWGTEKEAILFRNRKGISKYPLLRTLLF
jgi:hypothetical protein